LAVRRQAGFQVDHKEIREQHVDRRQFLVASSAAAAISFASRSFANDPCIPDFKRSKLDVGFQGAVGGFTTWKKDVDGWEFNFEEDDHVLFDIVISNTGPKTVQLAHCQPYTTGPWQVLHQYQVASGQKSLTVVRNWRVNNDSNFFFMEIEQPGGGFLPILGSSTGVSDASLNPAKTIGRMAWLVPQKVDIQIIAHDTRH
jgi:hypothetical protein